MHGQENYANQVGQGSYAPQSSFQQYPAAPTAPPPPPPNHHHGPLPPPPPRPPQVVQHGHPSFQLAPGSFPYPQGRPGVPQQVQRPPSGMHRPYLTPPPPQQGSNQVSYPGPTSQQQYSPWSQNVHQLPPAAPSAYQLPSSQGYTTDRGPTHQSPFQHALPPPPPPYASSSNISTPNPPGSSVLSVPKYSYLHTSGQLPPPPAVPLPPPPPPPLASPPGVPPLPPSSPPSDNLLKSDGVGSLNEHLLLGNNLMLERSSSVGLSGDGSVHTAEAFSHSCVKNRQEVEAAYTVATHSPADSDMDMEG